MWIYRNHAVCVDLNNAFRMDYFDAWQFTTYD